MDGASFAHGGPGDWRRAPAALPTVVAAGVRLPAISEPAAIARRPPMSRDSRGEQDSGAADLVIPSVRSLFVDEPLLETVLSAKDIEDQVTLRCLACRRDLASIRKLRTP